MLGVKQSITTDKQKLRDIRIMGVALLIVEHDGSRSVTAQATKQTLSYPRLKITSV